MRECLLEIILFYAWCSVPFAVRWVWIFQLQMYFPVWTNATAICDNTMFNDLFKNCKFHGRSVMIANVSEFFKRIFFIFWMSLQYRLLPLLVRLLRQRYFSRRTTSGRIHQCLACKSSESESEHRWAGVSVY